MTEPSERIEGILLEEIRLLRTEINEFRDKLSDKIAEVKTDVGVQISAAVAEHNTGCRATRLREMAIVLLVAGGVGGAGAAGAFELFKKLLGG